MFLKHKSVDKNREITTGYQNYGKLIISHGQTLLSKVPVSVEVLTSVLREGYGERGLDDLFSKQVFLVKEQYD